MNTIGEKIAQLRKERSMTQEELASVIGVSAQSVSKWENSVTMPDIMLLPVLAGVFEITVDEFFFEGKTVRAKTFPLQEAPERIYKAHLENMQRFWQYGAANEEITENTIEEAAEETRKRLTNHPQSHSGIVSQNNGSVYANHALTLSYIEKREESLAMLDSSAIAEFLLVVSDEAFRKILKYQLTNPSASFTAASVAAKCGISESDAETALKYLVKYNFMGSQKVDIGADELLSVYHLFGEYKIDLILYPLLNLAERLANYKDAWYGLSC